VAWDDPLPNEQLHPWYIDCCRRIRQAEQWLAATTEDMRVEEPANGQTGDPWAPIDAGENEILRVRDSTFRYDNLAHVLFSGNYTRPPSFSEVDSGYIVFRSMPKKFTERSSIRERVIDFPGAESNDPFDESDEDSVAAEAMRRVDEAGEAAFILKRVLLWLLKDFDAYDKNPEKERARVIGTSTQDGLPECERQVDALHAAIDGRFFEKLFEAPALSDEERFTFWEDLLAELLRKQAREAFAFAKRARRWERLGNAQSILDSGIRNTFTYAEQNDSPHDGNEDPADRDERVEAEMGQPDARAVANL
jgi:CRISPR system Cascade subunit CasA